MIYTQIYPSVLGELLLAAGEDALIGLWLPGQKYYACTLPVANMEKRTYLLQETAAWLDAYFAGECPDPWLLPLSLEGTAFQRLVWEVLRSIPYGETVAYSWVAEQVALRMGRPTMSCRAVGNAIGKNPLSILVPCHRVVGSRGQLTGYAGGLFAKAWLLVHEGVYL